jgi:hypothetical protein
MRHKQLNSISHYLGNGAQIMQLLAAEHGKAGTDMLYALRLVKEALKIVRKELNEEQTGNDELHLYDDTRSAGQSRKADT